MNHHTISLRKLFVHIGLWLGVLVPGLTGMAASQAETVAIPLGQQGKAWQVETPRKGITKTQVEAQYGAPEKRGGPVGDPPISTWDYPQFTVYFENEHVIHSVVKFDPADPVDPLDPDE